MKRFNCFFLAFITVVMAATSCQTKYTQSYYTFATTHLYTGGSSNFSFTTDSGKTLLVTNGSSFSTFKAREGVKARIVFTVDDESQLSASTCNVNLYSIDTSFVSAAAYTVLSTDQLNDFGLDTIVPDISSEVPTMTYLNTYVSCGFYSSEPTKHIFSLVHVSEAFPDDTFRVYLCHKSNDDYDAFETWRWVYMPSTAFDLSGYSTLRYIMKGNEGWYRLDFTVPTSTDQSTYPKVSIHDTREAAAGE